MSKAASGSPASWVAKERLRPPIKIHGGKHYLAKRIIERFTDHEVYTECFGGGLSVFLNKRKATVSVIHDSNPELHDLYVTLIRYPKMLIDGVNLLNYTQGVFYSACEENSRKSHDIVIRAISVIVRSRFSRGGMGKDFAWSDRLRGGKPGDVNSWDTYKALLPRVASMFSPGVVIQPPSTGWGVMERFDSPNVLHYADPPYLSFTRTAKKVYEYEMSEEDHLRFLATCNGLQGKVYISGYRSEMYDDLLPEKRWERVEFDMPNHSGQGEKKQRRVECLWISRGK